MKASKVVGSVIYNYLATGFVTVTGFAYTGFVVHRLSHGRYGILVLTLSIINYSNVLDLGIGVTVQKMVAERVHHAARDEITSIVRNAVTMFTIIGVIVFAACIGIEPVLGVIFKVGGHNLDLFQISLAIAATGIGISFPSAIYTAVHQAYGDYRYLSVLGIVGQVIKVGLGIFFLLSGWGIVSLVAVQTAVNLAAFFLKIGHSKTRFGVGLRSGRFSWVVMKQMFSMSSWVFILNLATHVIFSTDNFVAGAVLGTPAVASYQVALGPASSLQTAAGQFDIVSLTAAASLKAQDALGDLRRLYLEATRVVASVTMPGAMLFALWGRQLLKLWVGRSFESSYSTLIVLAIGCFFATISGSATQVVLALNRYKVLAVMSLVEAAVNLGLSVVLAHVIGVVGIALGTTIPLTLMTFCAYMPFACRLIELPYRRVLLRLVLPAAVNGIAYVILRLVAGNPHLFSNLIVLVMACGVVFAVCFSASFLLDPNERPTYIDMLRQLAFRGKSS